MSNRTRRRTTVSGALLLVMALASCGLVEELFPPEESPYALSVEPNVVLLETQESVQLEVTEHDDSGGSKTPTQVTWTSADPTIVAVDENGRIRAVGVGGPVEIVASVGSTTATAKIAVTPEKAVACPNLQREPGPDFALVGNWGPVIVSQLTFPVPARPESATHFTAGPGEFMNNYTPRRSMFPMPCGEHLLVVWQAQASGAIYATQISSDLTTYATTTLMSSLDVLIAAAFGESKIYLALLEQAEQAEERPARLTLHSVGLGLLEGVNHSVTLNTAKDGLNLRVGPLHHSQGHASLVYNNRRLALMLARTMHRAEDGLNHQGGIAAIFDANTLAQTRYLGQTSGHSFQNYLVPRRDGGFLGIDLADNYPRGVHLHHFDEFDRRRQVVFTFKTRHGTTPNNPAGDRFPVYDEISTGANTFYRWSNDNSTYSELGAVMEGEGTYTVLFIGEPDEGGLSIRNDAAVDLLTHSREVGLVTIRSDFEPVPGAPANVVPAEIVHSDGITEDGAFYTFNGRLEQQRNVGVRWLTAGSDSNSHNASRLKAGKLADDRILLVWERWSRTSYLDTNVMVVDHLGNAVVPVTELGSLGVANRLPRADDAIVVGGRLLVVSSNSTSDNLEILAFELAAAGE